MGWVYKTFYLLWVYKRERMTEIKLRNLTQWSAVAVKRRWRRREAERFWQFLCSTGKRKWIIQCDECCQCQGLFFGPTPLSLRNPTIFHFSPNLLTPLTSSVMSSPRFSSMSLPTMATSGPPPLSRVKTPLTSLSRSYLFLSSSSSLTPISSYFMLLLC